MRWLRHGFRRAGKPRAILLTVTALSAFGAVLLVPVGGGASGLADRIAHRIAGATPWPAAGTARNARPFGGVADIGALAMLRGGRLGPHFCTASVVDSPAGDLAVTAAHCVTGADSGSGSAGTLMFIPGYANGARPYGSWRVTRVYTDTDWRSAQDADHDVAFLRIADAPDGVPVEDVTGADRLGTASAGRALVRVTGYPDGAAEPVSCANWARRYGATQLEFDCGGYPDGTSGSPFLTGVAGAAGQGTVVGVIGGYEQGGDTPSVSYSVAFGPDVTSLFRTAVAGG